ADPPNGVSRRPARGGGTRRGRGALAKRSGTVQRRRAPRRASAPTKRAPKNGKPPGGDPAAPVRRRSCRGAGSATAGARLYIWVLKTFSATVFHLHAAAIGAARTPVMLAHAAAGPAEPFHAGAAAQP